VSKKKFRKHNAAPTPASAFCESGGGDRRPATARRFMIFAAVVVLAGIPFALGKYFELNFPDPFDSGGYVYSAKHILDGAKLGVDEIPSAKLGTLLVNMLGVWLFGFDQTGPKLMQGVFQAAALLLMFLAMRKLFGTFAAAVGVVIASVYLSSPLIAKYGNVKEQHMIAFMVLAVSSLVLRQTGGGWWWAVIAGAFVSWAPLFKETGTSAIAAMGLFVIAQPILKHRSFRQTALDILLLLAGAVVAIAPLYIWIIGWDLKTGLPYGFVWVALAKMLSPLLLSQKAAGAAAAVPSSDYVSGAWAILKPDEKTEVIHRIFRYYGVLILPISLAVVSLAAGIFRLIAGWFKKPGGVERKNYDRFVLLFAVWWLLDMAFVWISPRSYEQYYLPLNASAAMLSGYAIALYSDKVKSTVYKGRWMAFGVATFICMVAMSWHVFFGIETSPHTGGKYPEKSKGYLQKWTEISYRRSGQARGAWEEVADYIRTHSSPDAKIYVWGWYPAIYVSAQRISATANAFTSEMHVMSPAELSKMVAGMLDDFKKQTPEFIVDTRKSDYPWNRPPLELWPQTQSGFLPLNKQIIDRYDAEYSKLLAEKIEPAEAQRYEAMKPFREFVMNNYRIVNGQFEPHVLFQLKKSAAVNGSTPLTINGRQ